MTSNYSFPVAKLIDKIYEYDKFNSTQKNPNEDANVTYITEINVTNKCMT